MSQRDRVLLRIAQVSLDQMSLCSALPVPAVDIELFLIVRSSVTLDQECNAVPILYSEVILLRPEPGLIESELVLVLYPDLIEYVGNELLKFGIVLCRQCYVLSVFIHCLKHCRSAPPLLSLTL